MEQQKRQLWPDIAKALVMILVVLGHCNAPKSCLKIIASFHMPFFFLMSGYFYKYRNNNWIKDLKRLIGPYVACILLLLFFLLIWPDGSYYSDIGTLLKAAWFGSGSGYENIKLIGAIWFFLALYFSRRYLDFIFCLCKSEVKRSVFVGICLIIGILLSLNKIWFPLDLDISFLGTVYLYVGYLLNKKNVFSGPKIGFPVLLFAGLLWYMSYRIGTFGMADRAYGQYWFIVIPGSIGASFLVMFLCSKSEHLLFFRKVIAKFGQHTVLFLCVHDLDWRLPLGIYYQWFGKVIEQYKMFEWSWVLVFLRRFSFDLVVVLVLLMIKKCFQKGILLIHK